MSSYYQRTVHTSWAYQTVTVAAHFSLVTFVASFMFGPSIDNRIMSASDFRFKATHFFLFLARTKHGKASLHAPTRAEIIVHTGTHAGV